MSEPNGDKRSVATDALETLGTIIDATQKRDAIHLAVEPVVAGQTLAPGQDVGLIEGRAYIVKPEHQLGIVDPFLKEPVKKDQRFWLVVYPRQIHSLRHVWTHPSFADAPELADLKAPVPTDRKAASEAWLRDFISTADCPGYEETIGAAVTSGEDGDEYVRFSGSEAHGDIPPEFWDHLEIVTGRKFSNRPAYFSCSC